MKIYIDSDFKCHVTNPKGTYTTVETDFFDGKCDAFIEGYCYEIKEDGYAIYPFKPNAELFAAQQQYETMLAEMEAAYKEGVASA